MSFRPSVCEHFEPDTKSLMHFFIIIKSHSNSNYEAYIAFI